MSTPAREARDSATAAAGDAAPEARDVAAEATTDAVFDPLAYYHQSRGGTPRSARSLLALSGSAVKLAWRASPRLFALLAVLQLATVVVLGAQVLFGKLAIERLVALDSDQRSSVLYAALPLVGLVAATALTGLMTAAQTQLSRLLGERVSRLSWERILAVTTAVRLETFEGSDFFDALQRVKTLAVIQPLVLTQGLFGLAGGLLGVAGISVAVLAIQPLLLPILLSAGLPLWLISRRTGRLEFDFTVLQTAALRMRSYLTETMTGREEAQEIRAFALEGPLTRRWAGVYDGYLEQFRVHVLRRLGLSLLSAGVTVVVTGLALLLLVALVADERMSLASAGAGLLAVRLLAGRVQQVFAGISGLFESGLFLRDYHEFLERGADAEPAGGGPVTAPFSELALEGLSFRYPGAQRDALRDVNLTIRAGEVIALVGENGSGKTTLAKVLAGLFEPTAGRVLWDGTDVRSLDKRTLREHVGVIFQDFVRYQLSVRENVGFGREARLADQAGIEAAAARAGIDAHIRSLPDGYETGLSREFFGGLDLSGGQWQRIALARAYFRDAGLLVLDEPTASLDARAEARLFEQVAELQAGRTVLLISHRFSTVRGADRILVIHGGELVEDGTHDELMAGGGRYAELFDLQARSYR